MTEDDVPYPFGGWLEEHPQGGFLVILSNGTVSPVLRTYDAVAAYLGGLDGPEDLANVIRLRWVVDHDVLGLGH